ncbi:mediator of RNA polymerase II transcription subunit 1-like isoform X2 [Engystomops pustulosus]|uniref:mediator of RNA polymerase II transcription subunit 1-like isoform X2 n=1 Tax=Engystomops pustulosus TaxID=76066 RepID=UPI003AFA3A06
MEAYADLAEESTIANLWTPLDKENASVLLHAPIEYQQERKVSELAPVKRSSKTLLEKLHLKYSQKSWTETYKLVRYCLDKPAAGTIRGFTEHPILRCTNTLQEAVKAKSLSTLLTRIESISKLKGLESHLGPNGRICYITSEMFYIEVQVKKNGHVAFVKLAHHGESPTVCNELLLLLRSKDFEGFGKSLEGLIHLYNIPGNSDIKAKVYIALRSLEEDISALFNLSRPKTDKDRIITILHGKVGLLSPRSGGTPMNIEYYISPYQILEEKLKPGLPVIFEKEGPMHELLIEMKHKSLPDLTSGKDVQFVVSLSDCRDHCYVMTSRRDNENSVIGALVSKIPFIHPSHVQTILEVLQHQEAYNTLLSSCISNTINHKDHTDMIHFEVSLQRDFRFCISFQHPNGGNLSSVVVDILSCRKLVCNIYSSASDPPLPCNKEFILKILERCMSIPLTMRTIFKKAQALEVSKDMEKNYANGKNALPPICAGKYKKEGVIEQNGIPQERTSVFEENSVYDHVEDIFPDHDDGDMHSVDFHNPIPCPSREPNSSYTEDHYFHHVEMNSSGVDDRNSSVAEESYSSLAEDPSSSLVQELSPIMAGVPSPNIAEDPSSSITGELSSSITEELSLSVSGLGTTRSMPEHDMDECY